MFKDRIDAGEKLAEYLSEEKFRVKNPIVLGIPRGGLAVGFPVAAKFDCPLEPVTLRKLPIPENDQMGFGVVTLDKKVILNESIMESGLISEDSVNRIVDEVYEEVKRRDRIYRGKTPFPELKGRGVIITDDGLATGYTMLGAISFARSRKAGRIVAAVPVAHREAYEEVAKKADDIVCLHVSEYSPFAVASYYDDFHDMSDKEVIDLLRSSRKRIKP